MTAKLKVAIIGAGMGGLTAAAILARKGIDANVYEQATEFTRIGSGIQMSPNAMKVLRGIGLEDGLRAIAFRPEHQLSRDWDTGHINLDYPFGDTAERRYGAPYLLMHRGDLHALLATVVPAERIHRGKKLVSLTQIDNGARLGFEDGTAVEADAVIAADGVHSFVREQLFGRENPTYSGRVAYRTTFPASLLKAPIDDCTKWWGKDRHIVIYYTTRAKDEVYFVTSVPEPAWTQESWSLKASTDALRQAFVGFHPTVTDVLAVCPQVNKWAIFEREPMPSWTKGNVVLIGDACHPMTPYMAQGAATAMEDAAVLSRCLEGVDRAGVNAAFKMFEAARKERTAQIQLVSHQNIWLHRSGDTDWVFAYDAWKTPLGETRVASAG
ncbi:MAG TPA: FAD-dependent monooxygenase [Pseudolabrys sp.]|nr:FAD-dependent monooxygenase [Pseudolabrys sp.]